MSWQAGVYLMIGVLLLAGAWWYERSRPSSRILALVAALTALAVVGRIAFAAVPNVKPVTDIVLIAGYALGGVPGFAVGALTALVSNVFFGQGPWTPFQMIGWGLVGLFGAALARAVAAHRPGRELGRWPLALACGLAGAGFGLVMDLHVLTLTAQPSLGAFAAISAGSLAYNVAHVVGNVAFCLLFGPALLRALGRARRRFAVRWAAPGEPLAPAGAGAALLALVVAAAVLLGAAPTAEAASSATRAARFLASAQNADGGFGAARGQSSSQLMTGWSALGLAAAGRNPRDVARGRRSVIDYVKSRGGSLRDVGDLERTILVLRASGLSPRRFTGRDLVAELVRRRRADGSFNRGVTYTAFGILALRAGGYGADSATVDESARWLARQQNADGGFGFSTQAASDVDDTGAALEALAAAGTTGSGAVSQAVSYLRAAQNRDGGFGQYPNRGSNAQSTAYAVQGLVAAGRSVDELRAGGRSPLDYLRSLQRPDGSIRYSRQSAQTPVWVTAQALAALRRKAFPLAPVARARRSRAAAGASARTRSGAGATGAAGAAAGALAARRAAGSAQAETGRFPAGGRRGLADLSTAARASADELSAPARVSFGGGGGDPRWGAGALAAASAWLVAVWWWRRRPRGGAPSAAYVAAPGPQPVRSLAPPTRGTPPGGSA